jgi:hypothetical protein
MKEIKYEVEIKGSSPLLMNRYVEGTIEEIKVRKGEARKPEPKDKLYLDARGNPYIPSSYLMGALVEAGKSVKIQGKGKSTYSKLIGSTVSISPDAIPLSPNLWEPYTITAVNPMTRGRMSVTRPKFNEWGLRFEIIATEDIPEDKFAAILEEAGKFVGIGDWRPQKKGMYGKFITTKFKVQK